MSALPSLAASNIALQSLVTAFMHSSAAWRSAPSCRPAHNPAMKEPFLGAEALAAGQLTRHGLRTRFTAIHQGVYVAVGTRPTPVLRAEAAWLRSRRRGVLAGLSAAALHGAQWIDDREPAYLIDNNHRRERGIVAWGDAVEDDEIWRIGGMRVTSPIRTAVDLACKFPPKVSIPAIDALATATGLTRRQLPAALSRYAGRKGIVQARKAIALVDPGAQSPRETWLRLVFVAAGYPWPEPQCAVCDTFGGVIGHTDGGWREKKIGYEYEGEHHTTAEQLAYDIWRYEAMRDAGWNVLRFTRRDSEAKVLARMAAAWASDSERARDPRLPAA